MKKSVIFIWVDSMWQDDLQFHPFPSKCMAEYLSRISFTHPLLTLGWVHILQNTCICRYSVACLWSFVTHESYTSCWLPLYYFPPTSTGQWLSFPTSSGVLIDGSFDEAILTDWLDNSVWFCISLMTRIIEPDFKMSIWPFVIPPLRTVSSLVYYLIGWVGSGWCLTLEFFIYSRCFQNAFPHPYIVKCFLFAFL